MPRLASRPLGAGGPHVSAIGLGCMSMSWAYYLDVQDEDESVRVIEAALDAGVTHLDTAVMYGPERNEALVGRAIRGGRDGVVVASKVGLIVDDPVERVIRRDARPETLRALAEASLRRLGVEAHDLLYLHRIDPAVPVEESWGALAELVAEGKAQRLGLSECTVDELDRAHAIHPVAALQSELSLWTREPLADGTVDWCAAKGAAFVAFGVLGRGYLTGAIGPDATFRRDDFRAANPRFQPDALRANRVLVDGIAAVGARHGATPAQVCIAWALAQGEHLLAIPGTKRATYLADDLGADGLALDADDLAALDALPPAVGNRYQ